MSWREARSRDATLRYLPRDICGDDEDDIIFTELRHGTRHHARASSVRAGVRRPPFALCNRQISGRRARSENIMQRRRSAGTRIMTHMRRRHRL